jgi:hypothetical protein
MRKMSTISIEMVAAFLFAVALIHTFAAKFIERLSNRYPDHAGLFHLLGEVEVVFGFWAIVLVACMAWLHDGAQAMAYAESRQYTEPLFVFVVMVVAASKPILGFVISVVDALSRLSPMRVSLAKAWLGLSVVPLLGSAITEPAAMTIAALMLAPQVFHTKVPERIKYFALGVLFVNVSIGGTLTSYAAPPVLMVASVWSWDSAFMFNQFGWKSALAVMVNATVAVLVLRNHLGLNVNVPSASSADSIPKTVVVVHLAFLAAVIAMAHHPVAFLGLFVMFMGFTQAYERYQNPLILKEALMVGFFLAGLVVLGGMQQWWLQPIVSTMDHQVLFYGTTVLTAFTDNAALTYLGSQILDISDEAKYSLVAGAVAGGGLTVIANAPNPAGVALLRNGFAGASIGAGGLLLGSLFPTLVAMAALLLL